MRRSTFRSLFNSGDEKSRGRCVLLADSILENIIGWLTTGLFYTGFLMLYGIDIVNVSILTFIPYIASCFAVFGPSIMERLPRRKYVLAAAKAAYFLLNVGGITILPVLVKDPGLRIVLFVSIIFLANVINSLFSGGYNVWHLNFLPEEVRADYYGITKTVSSFIGIGVALASSVLADVLANSPYQSEIIIGIRYVALTLGLVQVALVLLLKEYPYARSKERPRLGDIITKPIANRKFLLTMTFLFIYYFIVNVSGGSINYYLLNNVGASYTFIQTLNMAYPFVLLVSVPLAKKLIRRVGWAKAFDWTLLVVAPTYIAYSFVTHNDFLILMPIVRISMHFLGTPIDIGLANMLYLNMPAEDQTNYTAFYTLIFNAASFLGMMSGTAFVAAFPDLHLNVLGTDMVHVQMLLLIQSAMLFTLWALMRINIKKIEPDDESRSGRI